MSLLVEQLQVKMDDCLSRGDSSDLVSVLRSEGLSSIKLTRLDQLVTKDLSGSGFSRVLVVLKSLEILSENRDDLKTLINHGLIAKVLLWFEAVHDLLTSDLQKSSAPLLNLTEGFYDFLLLLGQASLPVSQLSVVLLQLARFSLEPEIHFPLRLEAIRTFNSILESLSREQRRQIQNDKNQNQILSRVAAAVLTAGDYELQVSLSEALCRLTPRKERQHRANHWFSSRDISSAFCDIRDGDFEVDCRHFLNFVNCYHGDQRRVYTFPCHRAFLDSTELFPPKDDKLDQFWIDFNLSSGCVSFFIDEPQGFLWGSVHLLREDVDQYSLQVKQDGCTGAEAVLSVWLNNPIMHHNSRGQMVELKFNSELHRELEDAAGRVFMSVPMSPRVSGGSVRDVRSYSRKKPLSQLKVLPLSSPSSDEDSSVMKTAGANTAEFLFDQIRHSTPTYESGVPLGVELEISQEQMEEFGGSSSFSGKEVLISERKRAAPDSEGSPEGAGPPQEEGEGLRDKSAVSHDERKAELTSDITAAFNSFKTQLEQHFTGCWRDIEAKIILSLKECQQHVSSLLTAVHQHRLVLLQRFQSSVTEQLNGLQENSTSLNSINTQILSFFQTEMQRVGSFCDEHLDRLKSLESETEHPSHQ
ncbi:synaptonemal complex protein 2-like [Symphorus nematophorus]